MIKPNKDEKVVIQILVAASFGLIIGVWMMLEKIADKDKDIDELIEIVETQEDLIDRLLK
jgi:H+/Cl- antiporter ClcA|tara:strand:- start:1560 stop:1739 length:180 start_codon:yes stop_codon:yes gene_type:complete